MEKRDNLWDDDRFWYYSPTAAFIKWTVLVGIFLAVFLFFVGGYMHAQSRMRRGMRPMLYHRWFIPRRHLARFEQQQQHLQPQSQFTFYHVQEPAYHLHPLPPPAYNPNAAPPPAYQPPDGASKANPSQHISPDRPAGHAPT